MSGKIHFFLSLTLSADGHESAINIDFEVTGKF